MCHFHLCRLRWASPTRLMQACHSAARYRCSTKYTRKHRIDVLLTCVLCRPRILFFYYGLAVLAREFAACAFQLTDPFLTCQAYLISESDRQDLPNWYETPEEGNDPLMLGSTCISHVFEADPEGPESPSRSYGDMVPQVCCKLISGNQQRVPCCVLEGKSRMRLLCFCFPSRALRVSPSTTCSTNLNFPA